MRAKKKTITLSLYNQNPETNAYLIEVSLDDYSELFNGWDASQLRKKGLEPELMDYLEQASSDIPIHESTELCFYLPKALRNEEAEQKSIKAIANNFKVEMAMIDKQLNKNYRRLASYIVLAILFLTGAYVLRNVSEISLLVNIMVEGLFIGGWFLLWETFSLFFFDTHEIKVRRKIFDRYLNSLIYFQDSKQ